ncbi:hypothetical protein [Oricola sp.]|uniref:hypothetical protein n=1 Tax=Oricola sp. TaxID=1979950 RepID=UPI0025FB54E8|nr:hypothetical protein [Oricola sp.]MCI5078191.1 hypothetical protein [Oricola sp.]
MTVVVGIGGSGGVGDGEGVGVGVGAEVVVGGAEDAACAGVTTRSTRGFVHLPGSMTVVATPPMTIVFIICRRVMLCCVLSDTENPPI